MRTKFVSSLCVYAGAVLVLSAAERTLGSPLFNPNSFGSSGPLVASFGTLAFDTETLEVNGGIGGTGVIASQPNGPDVAVFTFDSVDIASTVSIEVTGSRPVALLSRASLSIAANVTLKGAKGATGSNGSAGAAGGNANGKDGGELFLFGSKGGGSGGDVGGNGFPGKPLGLGGAGGTAGSLQAQSDGTNGQPGAAGSPGARGVDSGTVATSTPGGASFSLTRGNSGGSGGNGARGGDGAGGGGGGGYTGGMALRVIPSATGGGGGAGGSGGTGGLGGAGGSGGGAIALIANDSVQFFGQIDLSGGTGGAGGSGGAGGAGGNGAQGSTLRAGSGGAGGIGGSGGIGGKGSGGAGGALYLYSNSFIVPSDLHPIDVAGGDDLAEDGLVRIESTLKLTCYDTNSFQKLSVNGRLEILGDVLFDASGLLTSPDLFLPGVFDQFFEVNGAPIADITSYKNIQYFGTNNPADLSGYVPLVLNDDRSFSERLVPEPANLSLGFTGISLLWRRRPPSRPT